MYPEQSTAQKLIAEATKQSSKRLTVLRRQEKKEKRALTWDDVFHGVDGPKSAAGIAVNEEKSLRIIAVFACVSYIADYVASLPKITYQRLSAGKQRAPDHYLYRLIHDQPNPYMNDYEFVETMTGHVLLWGNAFAEIVRDGGGRVTQLWPLRPDRMEIQVFNNHIFYYYQVPNSGEQRQLIDVMHLRGLGSDGILGYSPIRLAREAIGLAFAEEEYRARFFTNNGSPSGVLEHPGALSKEAAARLKAQWSEAHSGLSNAHRVAVLEEGIKWQAIGLPAKDIEFIEGRKYQKAEIATLYRIRPYKIGVLEPGTVSFASIEAQQIDNHIDTMRPWLVRWEKKFNSLFTPTEQQQYFVEFLMDAVLRGDTVSRYQAYQIARQNGWLNANEIRGLENMNPIAGEEGTDYWKPSNMVGGDEAEASEGNESEPEPLRPEQLNGRAH